MSCATGESCSTWHAVLYLYCGGLVIMNCIKLMSSCHVTVSHHQDCEVSSSRPPTMLRPPVTYPIAGIGQNSDFDALTRSCPSRLYHKCFYTELQRRYPYTRFKKRHRPYRCSEVGAAHEAQCRPIVPEEVPRMDRSSQDSAPLKLCPRSPTPPPLPAADRLRCNSDAAAVQARALLMVGVPSSPSAKGRKRRDAIRAAWMRDEPVGSDAVVCFILSAHTPQPALAELEAERSLHGDVLLVDAPETPWIIKSPTRYSNGTKRGRGMPTFKQHRFFQYAARTWPAVPFVSKFDDDTAPNMRLIVPLLRRLQCAAPEPWLFIGAINWAAVVPRAEKEGVRARLARSESADEIRISQDRLDPKVLPPPAVLLTPPGTELDRPRVRSHSWIAAGLLGTCVAHSQISAGRGATLAKREGRGATLRRATPAAPSCQYLTGRVQATSSLGRCFGGWPPGAAPRIQTVHYILLLWIASIGCTPHTAHWHTARGQISLMISISLTFSPLATAERITSARAQLSEKRRARPSALTSARGRPPVTVRR